MAGNSLGAGAAWGSLPKGPLAARCRARWDICRWWWGAWGGAAVFLDCPIDVIEEPVLTPEWPGALSLEVLVAVALAGALLPLSRCQVTVQVDFLICSSNLDRKHIASGKNPIVADITMPWGVSENANPATGKGRIQLATHTDLRQAK